uniref:Uncharacterized protein n=1 Tax=Corethron hystrix TaxID=216773 RepID=A0A7S1B8U0_9STRA|mmetsp:Transcript_16338/g.36768  ORF Transcript_16338/g.36768 Transcript_16338/m.36768 type:complete len:668 (+) Transcript_16338:129-2132(+)
MAKDAYSKGYNDTVLVLKEITKHSWKDLHPVLIKMAQFDIQFSSEQFEVYTTLEEVIDLLQDAGIANDVHEKGRLKILANDEVSSFCSEKFDLSKEEEESRYSDQSESSQTKMKDVLIDNKLNNIEVQIPQNRSSDVFTEKINQMYSIMSDVTMSGWGEADGTNANPRSSKDPSDVSDASASTEQRTGKSQNRVIQSALAVVYPSYSSSSSKGSDQGESSPDTWKDEVLREFEMIHPNENGKKGSESNDRPENGENTKEMRNYESAFNSDNMENMKAPTLSHPHSFHDLQHAESLNSITSVERAKTKKGHISSKASEKGETHRNLDSGNPMRISEKVRMDNSPNDLGSWKVFVANEQKEAQAELNEAMAVHYRNTDKDVETSSQLSIKKKKGTKYYSPRNVDHALVKLRDSGSEVETCKEKTPKLGSYQDTVMKDKNEYNKRLESIVDCSREDYGVLEPFTSPENKPEKLKTARSLSSFKQNIRKELSHFRSDIVRTISFTETSLDGKRDEDIKKFPLVSDVEKFVVNRHESHNEALAHFQLSDGDMDFPTPNHLGHTKTRRLFTGLQGRGGKLNETQEMGRALETEKREGADSISGSKKSKGHSYGRKILGSLKKKTIGVTIGKKTMSPIPESTEFYSENNQMTDDEESLGTLSRPDNLSTRFMSN